MTDSWTPHPDANLIANASLHRPDANLERLLALRATDPDRYAALPNQAQSQVEVYADMKAHHTQAVAAGLIAEGEAS